MKKSVFVLALGSISGMVHAQVVEKVTVFKRAWGNGTTASLTSSPAELLRTDTLDITGVLTPADFTSLLTTARKKRRHWQQKEVSRFSGTMQIAGRLHQYLYCDPFWFIDLTDRKEYLLDPVVGAAFNQKTQRLALSPK